MIGKRRSALKAEDAEKVSNEKGDRERGTERERERERQRDRETEKDREKRAKRETEREAEIEREREREIGWEGAASTVLDSGTLGHRILRQCRRQKARWAAPFPSWSCFKIG